MLFRVDPLASEPIFEQLVYQAKAAVARGELRHGERLPSVRELARELAINPNTVARAYRELEAGGVLVRRQGAGTFVKAVGARALSDGERRRRLRALMERAVTEAFHLGFDASELRAALDECVRELRFESREAP